MPLRAVLFDFGGTLLDMATDDEAHRRAFAWMPRSLRLPVDGGTLWRRRTEFMRDSVVRGLDEAANVPEGWAR